LTKKLKPKNFSVEPDRFLNISYGPDEVVESLRHNALLCFVILAGIVGESRRRRITIYYT